MLRLLEIIKPWFGNKKEEKKNTAKATKYVTLSLSSLRGQGEIVLENEKGAGY